MQNIIKYILATIFCFLFVVVKPTNAQYKPLDSSFLDGDGFLKYRTITVDEVTVHPKNISSLLVLILEDRNIAIVTKPKLKLIGENSNGEYLDLGNLRYDNFLRTDEAVAFFEKKNRLHIGSRLRGTFLFWNEYSWNGKKAVWLRTNQDNPKNRYLTSLPLTSKNYLAQGKIDKAIEVISKNKKEHSPEYMGLEFLKYADKITRKMQTAGKINKACKFMEEIFALTATEISIPNINYIKNKDDYELAISGDGDYELAIFGDIDYKLATSADVGYKPLISGYPKTYSLTFDEYLEIVAHYAVLLQQTGQLNKSIEILKQLITISPDNTIFYLYLADSFWLSNNKDEAITYYNTYISKAKSDSSNNKIAKRALYRTGTTIEH